MATRRVGNRRALGDIGNLVGALSATCVVTKAHHQQQQQQQKSQLLQTKFGAEPAVKSNIHQIHDKGSCEKENVEERRVASSKKKRDHVPQMHGPKSGPMEKEREEEESRRRKLGRRESASSFGSSMSMETAMSHFDSTEDHLNGTFEVEMEEVESPLPSIDELDARNSLAVVEYVDDIYNFYRKSEINSCVPSDYLSNQADINHKMRAILVDWLIEVHHKFELRHETLFLAINLIDRYLSRQSVMRKYLQLVGITGMLLASKYEEISVPLLEDFIYISDRAYTKEDLLKMEKSMLNTLQFNMSVPTPFVFMRRFLKAAEFDAKLEMVSFYLMELCMVEYEMLKFPPSLLSAAAVYTGRCILSQSPPWNKTLNYHSTYSEDQLQECVRLMVVLHQNASQGKLTAVYRKYSISKYSCIALVMKQEQQKFTST